MSFNYTGNRLTVQRLILKVESQFDFVQQMPPLSQRGLALSEEKPRRAHLNVVIVIGSMITTPLLFLLMILACDSDNPICGIDGTAVEENGIILTLRQKADSPPAHVSVLLKADMKSDVGRNVPLTNLRASNFTIFENDSRISVESDHAIVPKPGVFISHTLLLLDLSGSILEDSASLEKLKDASTKFIDAIIPASNSEGFGEIDMAIDWFDGEQKLHQLVPFTTNADALRDGIKRIREGISRDRSTNLNGAVIDGAKKVKDMTGIEDGVVSIVAARLIVSH